MESGYITSVVTMLINSENKVVYITVITPKTKFYSTSEFGFMDHITSENELEYYYH